MVVKPGCEEKRIVQIPVVEKAFSYLDGWSIEPTTTYAMFNGNYDLQDMLEKRVKPALGFVRISPALSVKEPLVFAYGKSPSKGEMESDLKKMRMVADVSISPKAKAPSGRAEVGKLYFSKPHIATDQWGNEGIVVDRAWLGVPGWVIKASSGATVTLPSPIDSLLRRTW